MKIAMKSGDGGLRFDSSPSFYLPRTRDFRDPKPRLDGEPTTAPSPDSSPSHVATEDSAVRRVGDTPATSLPLAPPTAYKDTEVLARDDTEAPSPPTSSGRSAHSRRLTKFDSSTSQGQVSPEAPHTKPMDGSNARRIVQQSDPAPPIFPQDVDADTSTRTIAPSKANALTSASENRAARPRKADGSRLPSHQYIPSSSSHSGAEGRPVPLPNGNDSQERELPLGELTATPSTNLRPSSAAAGISAPDLPTTEIQRTTAVNGRSEIPPASTDTRRSRGYNADLPVDPSLLFTSPSSSARRPEAPNQQSVRSSCATTIDASTGASGHHLAKSPANVGLNAPGIVESGDVDTPPQSDVPPPVGPLPAQTHDVDEPEPTPHRYEAPAEPEHTPESTDNPPPPQPAPSTPIAAPPAPSQVPPSTPPTPPPPPPPPPPSASPPKDNASNGSGRALAQRASGNHASNGHALHPNGHALVPDERAPSSKERNVPPTSNGHPAQAAGLVSEPSHDASHPYPPPSPLPGDGEGLDDVPQRPWYVRILHTICCCLCFK
ncbi:hypothetical protein C8Q70DRAFT_644588 [Cubamyces menziesii]|nr:hypothetical protein C8Q70DRAFT_644588 [Cubamyces menziesii]